MGRGGRIAYGGIRILAEPSTMASTRMGINCSFVSFRGARHPGRFTLYSSAAHDTSARPPAEARSTSRLMRPNSNSELAVVHT